jgi:hypothetical protein
MVEAREREKKAEEASMALMLIMELYAIRCSPLDSKGKRREGGGGMVRGCEDMREREKKESMREYSH